MKADICWVEQNLKFVQLYWLIDLQAPTMYWVTKMIDTKMNTAFSFLISSLNFLQYCFCFVFFLFEEGGTFGQETCGILAPWPGTRLTPLHWKVKWPSREVPATVTEPCCGHVPQEAWGARHQPVYGRDIQTEMSCLHRSSPDK